jgi:hypothetical protein
MEFLHIELSSSHFGRSSDEISGSGGDHAVSDICFLILENDLGIYQKRRRILIAVMQSRQQILD